MTAKRKAFFIILSLMVLIVFYGCDLFGPVSIEKRIGYFEDDLNLPLGDRGDTYLNFHPNNRVTLATNTVWDTNFPAIDQPYNITIDSQVNNGDGTFTVECSYTDKNGPAPYLDPHLRFVMKQSEDSWFIWSLTIEPSGVNISIP